MTTLFSKSIANRIGANNRLISSLESSKEEKVVVRIKLYVLCYDDASEQTAKSVFEHYPWARIYRIPVESQSHLFEGVMYQSELMKVYDEWKDVDFVGTISYKIIRKVPFDHLLNIFNTADPVLHDAACFRVVPSDLFWLHSPSTRTVYEDTYKKTMPHRVSALVKRYVMYNFWMSKPYFMVDYISFFNTKWLPTLESHPNVWDNSNYKTDYTLTPDKLLALTKKVSYYPTHPFVNERIAYRYMVERKLRILE